MLFSSSDCASDDWMTTHHQARKRKREELEDDIHELEGQRCEYQWKRITPIRKDLSALASTSAAFLPPGYTELDDVTAKDYVLKNPDLMAITFSHLKNDEDSDQCLFNAALTCKDFLDVALDALWEEIYSLVPLLNLLPGMQVENKEYVCANVHVFLHDLILSLGP